MDREIIHDDMAQQSKLRNVLFVLMGVFILSIYFSIAVNSLALGLIAITWIALMVVERRKLIVPTPLDYFFLAYVIVELISSALSYNPAQSFLFSKRLLLIGIVYLFASFVTTETRAKQMVAVLLGGAALLGIFGVLKLLFGSAEENIRLSIFQFYMTTAGQTMMGMLLFLPFVIHPATPIRIRLLALLGLLPVAISLYATVTRGSYLAVAAGILFIALVRNRKLLIPLILLIVLVVLFAPPYVESRIMSIFDVHHVENASRIMLWKTGMRMFLDYPVFGIGDIDMHELYLKYMDPNDPAQHGHFHNILIQFLVTLGAVGFMVIVAMFVRIFQTEWRIYQRFKSDWFRGSFALAALAVFVGLQVNGLTEWSFGDQEVVTLFWTTLGLTLAIGKVNALGQHAAI